jgi:hypothetical protein
MNLKSRHFDNVGVIEAESQAILNILTEYHFKDEIRIWHKLLRGWPVGPKLVFGKIAAPVPEIMDDYLFIVAYMNLLPARAWCTTDFVTDLFVF